MIGQTPQHQANVTDIRAALLKQLESRLMALDPCERCTSDRDEKCLDRGLGDELRFSVADVTCGCGCWTRNAFQVQLGMSGEDDYDD